MTRARSRKLALQVGTIVIILALPEILVRGGFVSPFALAPTSQIAISFYHLLASGEIFPPLLNTAWLILLTFVIVAVAGTLIGFCFWRWSLIRRGFEPLMLAYYSIPGIIFYPFILVVLGIGWPSLMGLGVILAIVPIILGVQDALRSVDPVLERTAIILGASPFELYTKVIFRAALPDIGSALRLGFSYVVIGVIAGQFLISTGGLGRMVAHYYDNFQIPEVYASAAFIVLLAASMNAFLERLK